jgi:hypothetical protein
VSSCSYLHNTDPEKWTFEAISEQFKIDFHVAKAVATAKWLPDKPKTKEGLTSKENLLIGDPTSQPTMIQVEGGKDENSKKLMNWKELSKSMGLEEEPIKIVIEKSAVNNERLTVDGTEQNQELVMRYTSGENSLSKWASSESEAELKLDTDSKNVYYYDSKHGYQVMVIDCFRYYPYIFFLTYFI